MEIWEDDLPPPPMPGTVTVTVATTQDLSPKPVAVGLTTTAKVAASATTPTPPPGSTLDPPSKWTWDWKIASAPPKFSGSITPDSADASKATISGSFIDSGDYEVLVQASVVIGSSTGATWTGTGDTTLYVTAVKVEKIQFSVAGGPYQDLPAILYVPVASTVGFKAIPSPTGASWPVGKPVWGGSSGASGSSVDIISVAFDTLSLDRMDFKTVTAECGNTVSANAIVYDFHQVWTPKDDFQGRAYDRFGVCETIFLSHTITPSSVTEYEIGGLEWKIESGGGDLSGGTGGIGTYICSDEPGTFVLSLSLSGGPFVGQKDEKKAAGKEVPTLVRFEQKPKSGIFHKKGQCSVGVMAWMWFEPVDVSFSGIVVAEGKCKPSKATGHYKKYENEEHKESTAWVFVEKPGDDGKGSKLQTADTIQSVLPKDAVLEDDSVFIWDIPWTYFKYGDHVGKFPSEGKKLFNVQHHVQANAAGTVTISKPKLNPAAKRVEATKKLDDEDSTYVLE